MSIRQSKNVYSVSAGVNVHQCQTFHSTLNSDADIRQKMCWRGQRKCTLGKAKRVVFALSVDSDRDVNKREQ